MTSEKKLKKLSRVFSQTTAFEFDIWHGLKVRNPIRLPTYLPSEE